MATWTGWPPRSRLHVYSRGRELFPITYARGIDLADTIIRMSWPHSQRTVELALTTESTKWDRWDENALALMEDNIRHDLGHDGYGVVITRLSGMGRPCTAEMRWRLVVRPK